MRLLTLISSLIAIIISSSLMAGIVNTKHNLSTSGTGTIKATDGEGEICVFCHTPHQADAAGPLWNRNSPGGPYTPYDSTTLIGNPGQPTGSSVLCLSCHDGTIALGEVISRTTDITLTDTVMPAGVTLLTNDLSDDHPVSFVFDNTLATTRGELVDPSTLTAEVKLDGNGEMQCTSCHNPHTEAVPKFLVKSNTTSALCQTCHVKDYWLDTSHKTSTATWNATAPDPWPHTEETTVANNACENCHSPHTAGSGARILNYAVEEDNCFACHNSNVANHDLETEFTTKASVHPITLTTGTHDAAETNVPDTARHVECYDCHNPHGAQSLTIDPLLGPVNGARGVDINGADVTEVSLPQEVCYRCHGDSTDKPAALTTRASVQTNTRLEYNSANSTSYHPVATSIPDPGATNVPSLITGSIPRTLGGTVEHGNTISCLDCHNNDENPNNGAGGTGPSGPHASINSPILERNYNTVDDTVESAAQYAMCYKCHTRTDGATGILDSATFARHSWHITGQVAGGGKTSAVLVGTPCNICHDPHASETQDNMINFESIIVTGNRTYTFDAATGQGYCSLSCHGQNHAECGYDRNTGGACGCGAGNQGANNTTCPFP